jgi:hypothetical protein
VSSRLSTRTFQRNRDSILPRGQPRSTVVNRVVSAHDSSALLE